ncbi:MAG: BON domain-containing protein [Actinomycetota bacterium]|nr:BON domain-containing protein [Actinomycetota bacterium]
MDVSRTEPLQYVAERVRDALRKDPRVGELDVWVRITGNRVFVNGNVATAERREAISEIVEDLLPGVEVCNETSVQNVPETEDQETLA